MHKYRSVPRETHSPSWASKTYGQIIHTLGHCCTVLQSSQTKQKAFRLPSGGINKVVCHFAFHNDISHLFQQIPSYCKERIVSETRQVHCRRRCLFYITDMMPALHNYVTVDPQAFLSDAKRMEIIYNVCKTVRVSFCLRRSTCYVINIYSSTVVVSLLSALSLELPLSRQQTNSDISRYFPYITRSNAREMFAIIKQ